MNWFRTLAHASGLLRRYRSFGGRLLAAGRLSPRVREIIILRTAARCACRYELAHHRPLAEAAGLTHAEIHEICGLGRPDPLQTAAENAAVQAVDQLCAEHTVDDTVWEVLAQAYTAEELVELLFLAGHYVMVAGVMNALRVENEPDATD
jgi:AhpD family alkylhydroperoxidase